MNTKQPNVLLDNVGFSSEEALVARAVPVFSTTASTTTPAGPGTTKLKATVAEIVLVRLSH